MKRQSQIQDLLKKGGLTLAGSTIVSTALSGRAYALDIDPINIKDPQQPTSLVDSIKTIVNTLLFAIGIVAVIMLIVGGFRYIFSGGNSTNTAAAKDTILYAVIGIVVALLSYAIVSFVLGQFSATP